MRVHFWGARGSIPVSGERFIKYGGNTTCMVFEYNEEYFIVDGGTGLKAFGDSLEGRALNATLAFTHVHWDHIQGLPFFSAAFHPNSNIQVRGISRDGWDFKNILSLQMTPPTFPVALEILSGIKSIEDFELSKTYQIGCFEITALDQKHPDGVVVYKIAAGGYSAVFATDVEHGGESLDQDLAALCQDCDLLIHDAQYTEAEYYGQCGPPRKGWGHSMWREAVDLAIQTNARRLALFHHDPGRSDEAIDQIESEAQAIFSASFASREGTCLDLANDTLTNTKGIEIPLGPTKR
ncbi:MAG: MBL fold metallo-hydrolase [Myxococcales bacterium]|nr:MBL fold metallo-hydrolase [Myxococcales bacterium]